MGLIALRRQALALYRDESGSEIVEYAIVTAVLSITVFAAFGLVSTSANNAYATDQNNVSTYATNSAVVPQ